MANKGILGTKMGMTQVFDENNRVVPVTVVKAGPNVVTRIRTPERDVHVHVCSAGSDWERDHLAFRDRLRASPADRDAYGALKQRLAAQDWPSMKDYADAKGPLIRAILARA